MDLNVAISLQLVKSPDNPADAPSRRLSLVDFTLTPRIWSTVQSVFGCPQGHTCDLMALDSNTQRDNNGIPLPHIAPVPMPQAMGVNFSFGNRRRVALLWYRTGTLGLTGGLSSILSVCYDCVWRCWRATSSS